jgi:glycosyltransferase involved in cell wall biosynthesis
MISDKIVSILVCCRNEENYISQCLESLINQKNIPGDFDILVIDGESEDNTRKIIFELIKKNNRIVFFENKAKFKPRAINIGFEKSTGKYIAICDAHTVYAEDYISTLIELINEHPEADGVGGPIISQGNNSFGKATAIAMSSKIGVGNPKHRFPDYEGYAEMACFPLFNREVLTKVGLYDERFIINHDDEYCFRIRKMGGKIYLSPRAKSFYYVRNKISKLFYQYYTYGFWQIAFLKKHKEPISLRQLVPITFFSGVGILAITGIMMHNFWVSIFLPGIYILSLAIFAVPVIIKKGFIVGSLFPLSVFILHLSYALGFLNGILYFNLIKRNYI